MTAKFTYISQKNKFALRTLVMTTNLSIDYVKSQISNLKLTGKKLDFLLSTCGLRTVKSQIDITLDQAFLDAAIPKIKNPLDLQYYQIPQGFELKQATVGKGKKQTQEIVTTS
ncbi:MULTISPECIES: hypothetical protein [unclassified Microcoleus]|uniref:hypothetical protein n=1 Tax=unclassified Microcoleus TaxID=2642155 RepID=UPI002FD11D89